MEISLSLCAILGVGVLPSLEPQGVNAQFSNEDHHQRHHQSHNIDNHQSHRAVQNISRNILDGLN